MEQKVIKGLTIEFNGETIDNVTNLCIDTWDKKYVHFIYKRNEGVSVNVACDLKDIKINIV